MWQTAMAMSGRNIFIAIKGQTSHLTEIAWVGMVQVASLGELQNAGSHSPLKF